MRSRTGQPQDADLTAQEQTVLEQAELLEAAVSLHETGRALSTTLDSRELIELVLKVASEALSADGAVLLIEAGDETERGYHARPGTTSNSSRAKTRAWSQLTSVSRSITGHSLPRRWVMLRGAASGGSGSIVAFRLVVVKP